MNGTVSIGGEFSSRPQDLEGTPQDLEGTRGKTKNNINNKIKGKFIENIEVAGRNKSKVQFLLEGKREGWTPGKPAEYMYNLTRKQASLIFKARTRMLNVKNNFRNKVDIITCRMCNTEPETQEHVLEQCKEIHKDNTMRTTKDEIHETDCEKLKTASHKIDRIMQIITKKEKA